MFTPAISRFEELGDQDSNLNKQYQKLLCYRYTIPENGPEPAAQPQTLSETPGQGQILLGDIREFRRPWPGAGSWAQAWV